MKIVVHTDDRPGMLAQLTSVLSGENTNIRSLEAKTETPLDGALVEMIVDVRDKSSSRSWWQPCAASRACVMWRGC